MNLDDPLTQIWSKGYSIAELWADFHRPTPPRRATSEVAAGDVPEPGLLTEIELLENYENSIAGAGDRYLIDRLRSGEWVAIGYRAPRRKDSRLEVIPRLQEAAFEGAHSSIAGEGFKFVGVRIVHAALWNDTHDSQVRRKPGRPSSELVIRRVFHRLQETAEITDAMPIGQVVKAVQHAISDDRKGDRDPLKGYGHEAVAKVVRKIRAERQPPQTIKPA